MISIDSSIIWAIVIFLCTVYALNRLLFQPLMRVQDERESRSAGLVARSNKQLEHYTELFSRYQDAIKNGRMEGYRLQEQMRSRAMTERARVLEEARSQAGRLTEDARRAIQAETETAETQLETEANAIAVGIAQAILQRSA
jgi:F-type H+-transporting ATPase subunit b